MKSLKHILLSLIILFSSGIIAQTHSFSAKQATIKWTGKKVGGTHFGYINLKEGNLVLDNHQITSGTFTLDMRSISNTDIEDMTYKKKLIGHLNSDDFFSTESYPEAFLEITESSSFENNSANVKGNLTIKGITHPIAFVVNHADHKLMATLTIDRSKYNVQYGSKSFFKNLGDKLIYDEFTIEVTLMLEH